MLKLNPKASCSDIGLKGELWCSELNPVDKMILSPSFFFFFCPANPAGHQSECFGKVITKKSFNSMTIYISPTPYVNYEKIQDKKNPFYIYCMLQIFALACSADQIWFCFCKMLLMKSSGKLSTEQIVKRSFNIRLVTNFLQYLLGFSSLRHQIVQCSPYS